MEKFRLILDKIQDCIEMQNGATESQLKTIWNDLSDAISESERRQKADTVEGQSNIPDVMTSLPKIRVHYMTEFGGRITVLELDKLISFMKKFKVLSLKYVFGNES